MPNTRETAQGTRPSFCAATSQAGAIPCTLCTTMALKRSLIALLPRHASRFPIAELEAFGSLVCTTRISESRMRNRWLRNHGDSLLQLRVFCLGFLQDGDVGVGVFPESEEVFVGSERPDAGGIGIRSLRGSRLQGVGTSHPEMCQRSGPAVPHNAAVVEKFLKLGSGSVTLSGCQVCLAVQICGIETGNIVDEPNCSQFDGGRGSCLQSIQGASRVLSHQRRLCPNRRQPKRLHLGVHREAFA